MIDDKSKKKSDFTVIPDEAFVSHLRQEEYNPTPSFMGVKRGALDPDEWNSIDGPYNDYAGEAPLNVSKRIQSKVEEGRKLEKAKRIGKKTAAAAAVAGNIMTLGHIGGNASEGRGSPKADIVQAVGTTKGLVGISAKGVTYAKKAYDYLRNQI